MPVSYYSSSEDFLDPTTTFNRVLESYAFHDGTLRHLIKDDDPPTWTVDARFASVTVHLDLASTKTIELLALSTAYDAGTSPFFYEIIGSTTITDVGAVTVEIPVVFNTDDFLGIMLIFTATDYANEITLVSAAANTAPAIFWTSYIGTTEVTL